MSSGCRRRGWRSCGRACAPAGATPVGCGVAGELRIAEGIPAYGVDIAERDLPQETSQMRALHFNKGCYLGQEIVERIRSRGNVHRHLRPLELTGPVPESGTELFQEDGNAGGTDYQRGGAAAGGVARASLRWAWCGRKRRHAESGIYLHGGNGQGHGQHSGRAASSLMDGELNGNEPGLARWMRKNWGIPD